MIRKYCPKLGIPSDLQTRFGTFLLKYTDHAIRAAWGDRYSHVCDVAKDLPKVLDTNKAEVFEVATDETGTVTEKVGYRIPFNDEFDLNMVVVPRWRRVVTCWLNDKNDQHKTLDLSKYDIPLGVAA